MSFLVVHIIYIIVLLRNQVSCIGSWHTELAFPVFDCALMDVCFCKLASLRQCNAAIASTAEIPEASLVFLIRYMKAGYWKRIIVILQKSRDGISAPASLSYLQNHIHVDYQLNLSDHAFLVKPSPY